jgi:hypothetical protein
MPSRSLSRLHIALAGAFALSACGAPQSAGGDAQDGGAADATEATEATEAAEAAEATTPTAPGTASAALPPACPLDLATMRARLPSVTATRANDPVATVQTVLEAGGDDDDQLSAWYEVRDAGGHEAGRLTWVCGPPGLALRRVEGSRGVLSFEPPLTVLPGGEGAGETAGVVAIRADGVDTVLDARHAWEAVAADAPATAPRAGAAARRVTSVLELTGDGHAWTLESDTVWVLDADGVFWPAASTRRLVVDGTLATEHVEQTGSLTFLGDVPRW